MWLWADGMHWQWWIEASHGRELVAVHTARATGLWLLMRYIL
jgi:hypothetical protein